MIETNILVCIFEPRVTIVFDDVIKRNKALLQQIVLEMLHVGVHIFSCKGERDQV